jgi:hypothetical protein
LPDLSGLSALAQLSYTRRNVYLIRQNWLAEFLEIVAPVSAPFSGADNLDRWREALADFDRRELDGEERFHLSVYAA